MDCPNCGERRKSKFPPRRISRYSNHWNHYDRPLCLWCSGVHGGKHSSDEKGAMDVIYEIRSAFCGNPYCHELDGYRIQAWYDLRKVKTRGPAMRAIRKYINSRADVWRASCELKNFQK